MQRFALAMAMLVVLTQLPVAQGLGPPPRLRPTPHRCRRAVRHRRALDGGGHGHTETARPGEHDLVLLARVAAGRVGGAHQLTPGVHC